MKHPVVDNGLLSYCPVCHLLTPCLDGAILQAKRKRFTRYTIEWLTVRQIRERLVGTPE